MLLQLNPHTKIKQLNRLLAVEFPYLKFEFYQRPGDQQHEIKMSEDSELRQVNRKFLPGVIAFNAHDTVASVEQRFLVNHQLNVQVLRKSGELWLRTTKTDGLELQKQNKMGMAASRPVRTNWNTLFL